ncbi:hypothetical protein AX14_009818, partial [Amanita brunnescens Koide BX004]
MTFAQMAATVLDPLAAAPMHPAKAKPTWRAIETNKSLVLHPGTKGTHVSELHIRVPKVPATTHLYSLSGTKLINEILRLVNESHNKEGICALKENHIVLVKWSMRSNLIIKCSKPMDDTIKDCLHEAIKAAVPPGSTDSIAILNKPPTTALKFSSVPRHNEDGTDTDSFDLHNNLMANELWRDVEIFSQPRFLLMKPDAAGTSLTKSGTALPKRRSPLGLMAPRDRSKENLKAYNAVTRKARSAFFEEKIAIMTAIKKPWEGVRWTRPRPPPPYSTIEINGQAPKDVDELFTIMHNQFAQAAARSPAEDDIKELLEQFPPLPERSFPAFSCQEIRDTLALTGSNSVPGPDHVTWELLKKALQINGAPEGLCHLFSRVRESG